MRARKYKEREKEIEKDVQREGCTNKDVQTYISTYIERERKSKTARGGLL